MKAYNDAIAQIQHGRCVLFTGAGFSIGANNACGKIQTASQIAADMYRICDVPEDDIDNNLMSAADWFLREKGPDELIKYLNIQFDAIEVAQHHLSIAKNNWKRCYTINYDNVLEVACKRNGKHIQTVTPSSDYEAYSHDSICVHLNGAISNLNRRTIEEEIKLSSYSYAVDSITKTNWWNLLQSDLITCDYIFFVGCSLKADFDVIRLINRVPDLKKRTYFIVGPQESLRTTTMLEQYGAVLKIGVEQFSVDIEDAPIHPSDTPIYNLKCFSSPTIRIEEPDRDLSHFTKLVTEGCINHHLLDFSLHRPDYFPYILYRDRIDVVESKIQSGVKNFIVYSDLGNGKTVFLHSLSMVLKRKGMNVFILDTDLPGALEEIEYISNNYDPGTIIIVENYGDHTDFLDKLHLFRNPNHILVLSERRMRYEVSQFLLKNISAELFFEISLDELSDNEIDSLIVLVDKNYLWGKALDINASNVDKRKYIINKCNRRLSQFILNLIKGNSDLKNRYAQVVQAIKSKQEHYRALLYIIINEVLGFKLTITDIITDLDYAALNSFEFNRNPYLKELIDFDDNRIVFRSSIFASYILREVLSDDDVKDAMVELFKTLHEKRGNKRIRNQLKYMTKHSSLMKVFTEYRQESKGILYYLRQIVDLEYCQSSPLFWLQYAIARLFDRDFANAETCFNNAYALAKSSQNRYDTYQIDNHHARFLLEARIAEYLQDDPCELFVNAHNKLIVTRKGEEQRWYSFKVAENYIPFYNKFYDTFSPVEKLKFKKCCLDMISKMEIFLKNDGSPEKERVRKTCNELTTMLAEV